MKTCVIQRVKNYFKLASFIYWTIGIAFIFQCNRYLRYYFQSITTHKACLKMLTAIEKIPMSVNIEKYWLYSYKFTAELIPKSTKIHSGFDGSENISFCYNYWLIIIWNVEITLILLINQSTKIHSGSDGRLNISFCYNYSLIIILNVELTLILVIS